MTGKYLGLLAVAAVFVAAGTPAAAADKGTFQLDWLPGGDKAPIYICVSKGFCAKEGLDVTIAPGRGSSDAITKMAAGVSDIGTAGLSSLMAAAARESVPVTAVMSYMTKGPHAFLTTKDTGIKVFADIKAKSVATAPFSSSNVFLPLVLVANGVPVESVKLTKTEPGAMGPMLMTGRVQAIIAWQTNVTRYGAQAKAAGKELVVLPWSDVGLTMYAASLMASDKFLKERPAVAKRFVKAYRASALFMRDNPKMAAEAVAAVVPEVKASTAIGSVTDTIPLLFNEVTEKDGQGVFEPRRLATTWKWVAKAQKLKENSLDPEKIVNRSFLN